MYKVHIKERLDPRGRPYYWIDGDPVEDDVINTDVHVLKKEKCPTITPISLDATSSLDLMMGWIDF
jgi:5'-nucleotidase